MNIFKTSFFGLALGLFFVFGQAKAGAASDKLIKDLSTAIKDVVMDQPYFSRHPYQQEFIAYIGAGSIVLLGGLFVLLVKEVTKDMIKEAKLRRALKKEALEQQQVAQEKKDQEVEQDLATL